LELIMTTYETDGDRRHAAAPQPVYGEVPRGVQASADPAGRRDGVNRPLRDRVRWGPIWAGLAVTLGTFLLLQLALVATGAVDLARPTTADAVASAVAAMVSFFLGGLVAGATAMWRGIDDGILHGAILWAVGLVLLVVLSVAGSGLALGSFNTKAAFDNLQGQNIDRIEASDQAKDAAGKALGGITVALIAAVAGGIAGAKIWPGRDERDEDIDLRS
jgi:hypothetical protein